MLRNFRNSFVALLLLLLPFGVAVFQTTKMKKRRRKKKKRRRRLEEERAREEGAFRQHENIYLVERRHMGKSGVHHTQFYAVCVCVACREGRLKAALPRSPSMKWGARCSYTPARAQV